MYYKKIIGQFHIYSELFLHEDEIFTKNFNVKHYKRVRFVLLSFCLLTFFISIIISLCL